MPRAAVKYFAFVKQQEQQHRLYLHDYMSYSIAKASRYRKQFNILKMIQCNDYYSQSSVISMIW